MEKSTRERPRLRIFNREYFVDIEKNCLEDVKNKRKKISFHDLDYTENSYIIRPVNFPGDILWLSDFKRLEIPLKVHLDPEGMCRKYKLTREQLNGKDDFEIIVDQQKYNDRVNNGKLPVLDIVGDLFFVDVRLKEARLTTDPLTKIDLGPWLDEWLTMKYRLFYDKQQKQAVLIDRSISEYPKNVVWVEIPPDERLDPVAVARDLNRDIKSYLLSHPFEQELKAKVVPLWRTELAAVVKSNKAALKKSSEEDLLKKNRGSGDKKKSHHL